MPDQLSRIMSLRDVASQINSDGDLDTLLRDLIQAACRHGSWDLGSIMTVDLAHGYALVTARHETNAMLRRPLGDRWELATSPALVALQRFEPVYIRDARESVEFPGYRLEAHERGYCTVLIYPMASVDVEGRPMVMSVTSRKVVDVSADDLAFMGIIVHLGAIAIERAHRHRAQIAAAEQLRRVLGAQGSLLQEVLAGGSIESLTAMLGDLLNAPVLILDFFASTLLASASPLPGVHDDAWRLMLEGATGRQILGEVRDAATTRRAETITLHLGDKLSLDARIEPLMVDDEAVGALLTFDKSDPNDLQKLLIESAKFALSVQLMRSVIRFRFETRTLTELFFEIVERRWRDEQDMLRRARRLGLSLASPMRMLVTDFPDRTDGSADLSIDAHRAVAQLAAQLHVAVHIVTVGGALVCLVPQEEGMELDRVARLAQRVSETLFRSFGSEPIVVVGDTCEGLESIAKEWERCWRMIRVARTFGRRGAMTVPDFGPLPMLIGAADSADVRSFIDGAIGRVVEYDKKHKSAYLETLAAYVRSGCRSQHCADAMELHVTTLRYRLSRISDLFGIQVETPEQRFAIELALQLHSLVDSTIPSAKHAKPIPRMRG
ncbi:helix-turn-helix domain-containing protein [Caballeronia sp. KNU42]